MKNLITALLSLTAAAVMAAPVEGWLHMRGPLQTGVSLEKQLPDKILTEDALWTADLPGRSTPTVANGRIFVVGHLGEGANLQEGVFCFDADTGEKIWERKFNDFLSDIIYTRYSASSPTIDPETGNLFYQGTQGLFASFTQDGEMLWQHSLMEALGRMTFPNGRTATPVVDRDLVITRGIMANWGAQGPPWDRFYGFDKKTGELVWAAKPGGRPKDSCFSSPALGWLAGKRVFYATTGDGILTGLLLAGAAGRSGGLRLVEPLTNGSIVLLLGAFAIGWISGETGMAAVSPLFVDAFRGVLCLFLLDMGLIAGRGLVEHGRKMRPGVVLHGLYMPLIAAGIALAISRGLGLSPGNAALLMTLAASASYIAVPAAMRLALPKARPALSLTLSLGITFPFNLLIGIPFYFTTAQMVLGGVQ